MSSKEVVKVVLAFEQKINNHDVSGIISHFRADGRFIDSLGNVIGMDRMEMAWTAYFRMVPDYRITHEELMTNGDTVAMFGKAQGTYTVDGRLTNENFWTAYAGWLARVETDKLKEWRVYCDNEPIREVMRKHTKR